MVFYLCADDEMLASLLRKATEEDIKPKNPMNTKKTNKRRAGDKSLFALAQSAHGHLDNRKGARADRHGTQQGRADALPETAGAAFLPRRGEAVAHRLELLVGAEAVGLHLALDNVKGVGGEPEELAGETAVHGNLPAGNVLAVDAGAAGVIVHHPLERGEPGAVGGRLTQQRDRRAAVQTPQDALMRNELSDAVDGAGVQLAGAVGLALETNTDVLDGAGEDGVDGAGERTGGVVLGVGEALAGLGAVAGLEPAARGVEGGELDGDAGADADERREGALVEGGGAFVAVDGLGGVEGAGVLGRGLEAHLDNVKGLADEDLGDAAHGAGEEVLDGLGGALRGVDLDDGSAHGELISWLLVCGDGCSECAAGAAGVGVGVFRCRCSQLEGPIETEKSGKKNPKRR